MAISTRFLCSILAFCILLSNTTFGRLATQQEMDNVCQNWLTEKTLKKGTWAGSNNPKIFSTDEIVHEGQILARFYNIFPKGHIVIPVLMEMSPVKFYSDKTNLDISDTGPIQLIKDVLLSRYRAFESVYGDLDDTQPASGEILFDQKHKMAWERFAVSAEEFVADNTTSRAEVGPLLTTAWTQHPPYNNLCPMLDGGRTFVGCAATAAAQLLNYYQWPPRGVGSHSFTWDGNVFCGESVPAVELIADFSDEYDWDNMPDNCESGCTQAEEDAVAELSYELGVAMDMAYGTCASGTNPPKIIYAFLNHFRYNPFYYRAFRTDYTPEGWFALIQEHINAGHPLFYQIHSHGIICDGWRDDGGMEYHMNYGWGLTHEESYDVWYVLDNLYCYWIEGDLCPYEYDDMYINLRPQYDPILQVAGLSCDDIGVDDDGHADPGETIELDVALKNEGHDAETALGTITTADPYLTINTGTVTFDIIGWGEVGSTSTPFNIEIDPTCPDPYWAALELEVSNGARYSIIEPFCLRIGDTKGFSDNMESGEGCWTHKDYTVTFGDEWHLSDYRGYDGSTYSWKVGGTGSTNYSDELDACLITPTILLSSHSYLSFQHWIDIEPGAANIAWDGAIVMISTGDGLWTQLTPLDGYTHIITDNTQTAFPAWTPCFSGSHDWEYVEFDLSAYSGEVQLMFRFSSDRNTNLEGWYIDDMMIDAYFICGDVDGVEGITILDVVYLINYKYKDGPDPFCSPVEGCADVNSDGTISILDVVYIINYKYKDGPDPVCP